MQIQFLKVTSFQLGLLVLIWFSDFSYPQSVERDTTSAALSKRAFEQLQESMGHELQIEWNANGTPIFLSNGLTSPGFVTNYSSTQAATFAFLQDHYGLFQIKDPTMELQLIRSKTDELGMTHLRFQQKYKDLPVWGCELIVHFCKDGSISSINGRYQPSFTISLTPALSSEAAINRAKARIQSALGKNPKFGDTNSSLVIFFKGVDKRLAWLVSLPSGVSPNSKCIIDAITGEVLWIDTGIRK